MPTGGKSWTYYFKINQLYIVGTYTVCTVLTEEEIAMLQVIGKFTPVSLSPDLWDSLPK